MLLVLVRHADAGERDPARWPDDTLRPITEKGRKIQGKVVKALRDAAVAPEVVLTSPWLRAAQTAELLTQGLGIAPPVPAAALAIDFPKSGVLGVEADRVEAKGAALRFFLRPKML
jgi:phosphohistidine phosphatase